MSTQTNPNFRTKKGGGGCSPIWAGGCLVVLVAAIAVVVGVLYLAKSTLNRMGEAMLSDNPIELPQTTMDETQRSAFLTHFSEFETAVNNGTAKDPFSLTGSELNLIATRFVDTKISKYMYLDVKDSKLSAEMSLPADALGPLTTFVKNAKGKYLNFKGIFTVSLLNGRLVVFLDSAEVKGEPVSGTMLGEISKKNLAEDWKNNNNQGLLGKLKGISLQGDTMLLQP